MNSSAPRETLVQSLLSLSSLAFSFFYFFQLRVNQAMCLLGSLY